MHASYLTVTLIGHAYRRLNLFQFNIHESFCKLTLRIVRYTSSLNNFNLIFVSHLHYNGIYFISSSSHFLGLGTWLFPAHNCQELCTVMRFVGRREPGIARLLPACNTDTEILRTITRPASSVREQHPSAGAAEDSMCLTAICCYCSKVIRQKK